MSSEVLLQAENLSKEYEIYPRPSDRFKQTLWMGRRQFYRAFPALEGINFEVRRGECLGIIGRNGAGKSTLLSLLAGTVMPSSGIVRATGRIAPLLELGSGFHSDFTGRENLFLNAAMLGLSRRETEKKVASILDFAEIGEFIDQPVKSYSSGMFLRLGFAIIAHVDADVFLIDEALAVGDIFFQQKCYSYLEERRKNAALVLVSHDLNAISTLCDRVIVLDHGKNVFTGNVREGIDFYTHLQYGKPKPLSESHWGSFSGNSEDFFTPIPEAVCTGDGCRFRALSILYNGKPDTITRKGTQLRIAAKFTLFRHAEHPIYGYFWSDKFGRRIFGNCTCWEQPLAPGNYRADFSLEWPDIAPGDYTLTLGLGDGTDVMAQNLLGWCTGVAAISSIAPQGIVHGIFNGPMEKVEIGTEL